MTRIEREQHIVRLMIGLYCRKHHLRAEQEELCNECRSLSHYALLRLERCIWGEDKGFCSHCPRHCYGPKEQEAIRRVMRWCGPRMILYEPRATLAHLWGSMREKIYPRKRTLPKKQRPKENEK